MGQLRENVLDLFFLRGVPKLIRLTCVCLRKTPVHAFTVHNRSLRSRKEYVGAKLNAFLVQFLSTRVSPSTCLRNL